MDYLPSFIGNKYMILRYSFSPMRSANTGTKNTNKPRQLKAKTKPIEYKKALYLLIYTAAILAFTGSNNALADPASALENNTRQSTSKIKDGQQASLRNEGREVKEIERIEIIGQINTGLMQSQIALADTSSPDLRSQLSQLPGVSVNGNGLVSGIVQYRGLFGDRLKVKIDGIEIAGAGPNAMDSPLSHALGNRHEIVLYQGIAPVSVGYETLAGAIEIKDVKPLLGDTKAFAASTTLSASWFTNNDAKMVGVNTVLANNQNYASLQGQYQDAQNYESGAGLIVPSTFYERSGLKFKVGRQTDEYQLDLLVGTRNTNESGTPALAMDISFVDALWYKLNFERNLNNDWKTKVQLFGNQNQHVMNNFNLRTAPALAAYRQNTVDSEAVGVDLNVSQKSAKRDWQFGANYYLQAHNSRITNPNNTPFFIQNFNNIEREVGSVYVQYNIAVNSDDRANVHSHPVHWQLGGRLTNIAYSTDEVDSNMVLVNPNIAVLANNFNTAQRTLDFDLIDLVVKAEAKINDSLRATLSFGQKERAPSYNELYSWFPLGVSAGLADGRNYLGNLTLEKETAGQIDIGLQLQHDGLTVMGNIFYHNIDNYIIGVPSSNMSANMIASMMGAQPPLQWDNRKAKLHGADLYISKIIGAHWQATMSGQWVKGKLSENIDGQRYSLYRIAPLNGNISLRWSQADLSVSVSLNVSGSQEDVSLLQNESPTPGYALWNLNLHYQVMPTLALSLVAENLLDKDYAQHLGGINRVSGSAIAVMQKVPEMGRNIGLYAEYSF
jgi:iron complex outermembrane receptor protein